jgi:hypothetical protein
MVIKTKNATCLLTNFVIMGLGASSQEYDIVVGKGHYGRLVIGRVKFEEKR